MSHTILGISCWFHDSAAALIRDGVVLAAVQEERFSGIKNDPSFPAQSIHSVLETAGINPIEISEVVFYEKPFQKFDRILETVFAVAPSGLIQFGQSMPLWLKQKLFARQSLAKLLKKELGFKPALLFATHHQSHAASAFFPSPFEEAAILCVDAVGEWTTTSGWHGKGNTMTSVFNQDFPHSLGLLYSAFTAFCGFKVNSGEYKLMGLAPLGKPRFKKIILDELIDLKEDGSFWLNMKYFDFLHRDRMCNPRFSQLFDVQPRIDDGSDPDQVYADLAASIQFVTEDIMLRLSQTLKKATESENLCLAGGVALNCVANAVLRDRGPFKRIWIQPASGDAGAALGCALAAYYDVEERKRVRWHMETAYLGPLANTKSLHTAPPMPWVTHSEDDLVDRVVRLLADGGLIGMIQGRMEFGPRALGNRSLLAAPFDLAMRDFINASIKHREPFRPFAPVVIEEKAAEWYKPGEPAPFMTTLAQSLSDSLGAVTHVDGSARLQTISQVQNPLLYRILLRFGNITGTPVLLNTSLNGSEQPILNDLREAIRFMQQSGFVALVVGNRLLLRDDLPAKLLSPTDEFVNLRELRWFGAQCTLVFSAMATYAVYYKMKTAPLVLFLAFLLFVLTVAAPENFQGFRKDLKVLGKKLAEIFNTAVLGLLFVTVFGPAGMVQKLWGRDPLQIKSGKKKSSMFSFDRTMGDHSMKDPY